MLTDPSAADEGVRSFRIEVLSTNTFRRRGNLLSEAQEQCASERRVVELSLLAR